MTSAHGVGWLQANTSITFGDNQDSNAGTTAVAFVPIVSSYVGQLAWFRSHTGSAGAITRLQLWDTVTQTAAIDLTSFTDSGSVGWQETDVSGLSVAVYAGREYRLAWQYPANTYTAGGYVTSYDPGGGSCNYAAVPNVYRYPPGYGYPNNPDATKYLRGLDIQLNTGGGTPPAGGGDADLARWLRADSDNSHKDTSTIPGLPWTTKQAVDAAATDVGTALTRLDNVTSGEVTTYGLRAQSIGAAISWVLANLNSALQIATTVRNWVGQNGSAPSDWDLYGQVQDMSTKLYAVDAKLDRILAPPAPASWVSQGTQTFDTDLAWAQEADVYTITYSSTGSAVVNSYPSGVDVAYRVLWWSVWDGERMRDRRFADGVLPVLYDGGARMPGIVLHSTAGASGTVEAWTLS